MTDVVVRAKLMAGGDALAAAIRTGPYSKLVGGTAGSSTDSSGGADAGGAAVSVCSNDLANAERVTKSFNVTDPHQTNTVFVAAASFENLWKKGI